MANHPWDKIFDECERKFETSNFADGSILFYKDTNQRDNHINGGTIDKNKSELFKICSSCPKFEWCLVMPVLIDALTSVQEKKDNLVKYKKSLTTVLC